MSQQDLEQSATQNKLSTMEQLDIKVEPKTHNDNTPHVHNMQQMDTFLTRNKKDNYKSMLHHAVFIKDDPDSDNKWSELIDDTQVMCTSTSHSSDGITIHIKEEPADDVGYDKPAPPLVTQMVAQTASGLTLLPVPIKVEVENGGSDLRVSSIPSLCKQEDVPSGLRTEDVCVSGNSDSTRTVSVKEHAKGTASGNTYPCDVCHKCFSKKSSLQKHIHTHTRDKPYKCNICSKAFNSPSSFNKHSRIHTGEKLHKCDVCDKSYNRLSYLKSHILTHTGEKPYKCDMCDKSFRQLSSLRSHILKHTGKKPYKCDMCDKRFRQSSSLRKHVCRYKCDMHDKNFTDVGTLTRWRTVLSHKLKLLRQ